MSRFLMVFGLVSLILILIDLWNRYKQGGHDD